MRICDARLEITFRVSAERGVTRLQRSQERSRKYEAHGVQSGNRPVKEDKRGTIRLLGTSVGKQMRL